MSVAVDSVGIEDAFMWRRFIEWCKSLFSKPQADDYDDDYGDDDWIVEEAINRAFSSGKVIFAKREDDGTVTFEECE